LKILNSEQEEKLNTQLEAAEELKKDKIKLQSDALDLITQVDKLKVEVQESITQKDIL